MKILLEVGAELFSMFMADARMTVTTLVLVAIAFALLNLTAVNPVWVGAALLIGCLVNVVDAAVREKRIRAKK
jgi:chromate transport protein ChrA